MLRRRLFQPPASSHSSHSLSLRCEYCSSLRRMGSTATTVAAVRSASSSSALLASSSSSSPSSSASNDSTTLVLTMERRGMETSGGGGGDNGNGGGNESSMSSGGGGGDDDSGSSSSSSGRAHVDDAAFAATDGDDPDLIPPRPISSSPPNPLPNEDLLRKFQPISMFSVLFTPTPANVSRYNFTFRHRLIRFLTGGRYGKKEEEELKSLDLDSSLSSTATSASAGGGGTATPEQVLDEKATADLFAAALGVNSNDTNTAATTTATSEAAQSGSTSASNTTTTDSPPSSTTTTSSSSSSSTATSSSSASMSSAPSSSSSFTDSPLPSDPPPPPPFVAAAGVSATSAKMRHLARVLKHKTDAQAELYANCLEVASHLQPKVFIEVGHPSSDNVAAISSMPLSGAVIAVGDSIDVEGFSTRYDVVTSMLHKVPKDDQPFIRWMRFQGARVAGKLVGASPLAFEETSDLTLHSAAVAINNKACHYAILDSFIGAAGLAASCKFDVVTFKPGSGALEDTSSTLRFASTCGSMSIMASRIDDIMYLWEVYTGTNRRIEELSEKYSNEAHLTSMAAAAAQQSGGSASAYVQAANLVAEAIKAPPTMVGLVTRSLLVSSSALAVATRRMGLATSRIFRPRRRGQHVHAFTSSWQQRREGVLKVGIPIALIDSYCGEKMSAAEFEAKLKSMYETLRLARRMKGLGISSKEAGGSVPSSSSSTSGDSGPSNLHDGTVASAPANISSDADDNEKRKRKRSRWSREAFLHKWWKLWSGSDYDPTAALLSSQENGGEGGSAGGGAGGGGGANLTALGDGQREYRIDFIPINLNIDLDRYATNVQKIASFELAEQFEREASRNKHLRASLAGTATSQQQQQVGNTSSSSSSSAAASSSSSSAGGAHDASSTSSNNDGGASTLSFSPPASAPPAEVFGTGLFEELPENIVTTLFDARSIQPSDYQQMLQLMAERTSSTIDEVFVDVDILCLPILSEPFTHLNIRSSSFSLPFVKNGNPLISLKLSKDISVLLVGELGRSTQLLEDAISFEDHVKGEEAPGKWWRKALFGEQGGGGGGGQGN